MLAGKNALEEAEELCNDQSQDEGERFKNEEAIGLVGKIRHEW